MQQIEQTIQEIENETQQGGNTKSRIAGLFRAFKDKISNFITDAPKNKNQYVRKNGAWVVLEAPANQPPEPSDITQQLNDSLQEAKDYTDKKITDLQIGGRNLIRNSHVEVKQVSVQLDLIERLIENEFYTFSFEAKGNLQGRVFFNQSVSVSYTAVNATDWTRIVLTFQYKVRDYQNQQIYPHIYGATNIRKYQLEKGHKASDYRPALEDAGLQFNTFVSEFNKAISITDNIVLNESHIGRILQFNNSKAIRVNINGLPAGATVRGVKNGTGNVTIFGGGIPESRSVISGAVNSDFFLIINTTSESNLIINNR
ncbi:hypothetical protein CAPN004_10480 [Capnocytophaga cynodegmi]|uniref:hypothetical protein n=1 Tax=Capnocytophaga cynodegmi TaxID=28189 RepID=UPI001AC84F56|nr:hypothetical protein [Capnocytophaga cynodegmi]GIM52018.1 hypothetical protein CAPN004_10480 [Capnocytophaga cynodegmi]